MNPLLLKPCSDQTSQVVLNGKPIGNRDAWDYFRGKGFETLRTEVCAAYDRLASRYNPIVLEGAGSISEINLRDKDLVNLPMARHAGADVFLVADIDRGGVFASAYGSVVLQTPEDRKRIKGIIINKFRGDKSILDPGIEILEEKGPEIFESFTAYQYIEFYTDQIIRIYRERPEILRFSNNYKNFISREKVKGEALAEHLDVLKPAGALYHKFYEQARSDKSIRTAIM